METMTITVGDFKVILPSSARVPGVNLRPDAIELDFRAFTGKLVIPLPASCSKDGRSQSLNSGPSHSVARTAPPISSQNQQRPYDCTPKEDSVRTPLPSSPGRQTFSDFLRPDPSSQFDMEVAAGLNRAPHPPQDLCLTPMWGEGHTQSAGLSQRIQEAAELAQRQPSQLSVAGEETSAEAKCDASIDGGNASQRLFTQAATLQKTECEADNESVKEPKVSQNKRKKRQRKIKNSTDVKRKRVSPTKNTPTTQSTEIEKSVTPGDDASVHLEGKDTAPSPAEKIVPDAEPAKPSSNDVPSTPVEKTKPSSSSSVPAALENVVSDGKRVRFQPADDSSPSPTKILPVTTPILSSNPWTTFPVTCEDSEVEPAPRWGSTLTRIDEESALLLGGESAQSDFFKEMTHLDLHGKVWNRSRDTPDMIGGGRAWHTTTLIGNCLLVFGGEVKRDGKRLQTNDCVLYDTTYFAWYNAQVAGTPPTPRSGHCSASVPGTKDLIIFGGINGKRWLSDLHRLSDLAVWSAVKSSKRVRCRPSARSYATLTTLKDCVVLFGGNNKNQCFNDVHLLKMDMTWTFPIVEGRTPKPRTGHCAVGCEDGRSVIVYGGWDDQGVHRLFYSDVWKLTVVSMTTCEWTCLYSGDDKSKMPGPRAGAGLCAAVGGKAYLFGGWHRISYFNDVLEMNTECS